MILGNGGACDLVGFPVHHGTIFQEVANQLDVVILSRAVGRSCAMLIEEGNGLNPGTGHRGYNAFVTGDYDLFAVWPRKEIQGRGTVRPTQTEVQTFVSGPRRLATGGNRLRENCDVRRLQVGQTEHFMVGNISQQLNLVKVMLNTRIQAQSMTTSGQVVHHGDEVGNTDPKLQTPLDKSFPIIAFVPMRSRPRLVPSTETLGEVPQGADRLRHLIELGAVGLETVDDLKQFCRDCQALRYALDLRPDWVKQLGY